MGYGIWVNFMKYFTVYKNSLSSFLQYRLNVGLIFISHLISLSGLVFLWLAVYASGQQVGNYSLEQIIVYFVLVAVIRSTLGDGVGMGFEMSEEINRGEVVNYLLRPLSYFWSRFWNILGTGTINIVLITPVIIIIGFLGRNYFTLPNWQGWLNFLIVFILGVIFEFLIYFVSALSAFWLHRGQTFIYGTLLIVGLLNGSMVPLDIFPNWAFKIIQYLPFQFLMFVPIQTFLGRVNNLGELLLIALAWIIVLSSLTSVVWRAAVKKFEAVGR